MAETVQRGRHITAARSFVKHLQERGLIDRGLLELLKRLKMKLAAPGRFLDRDDSGHY